MATMSEDDSVRVEREGPVVIVTIHRPAARNAVDGPTARRLAEVFRAFDADPEASVAILRGSGEHFCGGADLKAVAGGLDGHSSALAWSTDMAADGPMGPTRLRLTKPVIAAVEGYAVAGGLELALWCDLRVAAEGAIFGVFCRRFGVPLIDGGTVRLPRLIGESRALDLILTGRPVAADEALAFGLANRVVPNGQALDGARALALQIAAFPQTCLRGDLQSAREQAGRPFAEAMANEIAHGVRTLESGESVDGARRFAAGRGRHGAF
jgi:enoyl-CoA hydratase